MLTAATAVVALARAAARAPTPRARCGRRLLSVFRLGGWLAADILQDELQAVGVQETVLDPAKRTEAARPLLAGSENLLKAAAAVERDSSASPVSA